MPDTPGRAILRPPDFEHHVLPVGDLHMHMVIEGPENAPLIVLLHGFPEFWYSWRHQIKALAAAGYRVVVPDQRGYNLTDKRPPYDIFTLAHDVKNLVQALGYEKAAIVGHDFGGGIAWLVAAFYPGITTRLIVCNCPHPMTINDAVRTLYVPQLLRSYYIAAFRLPAIPEVLLSANNHYALRRALNSGPNKMTAEEIGYFREAWSQPGALSAGITWYRETLRVWKKLVMRDTQVRVPACLIWGEPDFALTRHVAEQSRKYCPDLEINYIADSGHFVQQDLPQEVNRLMLEFMGRA